MWNSDGERYGCHLDDSGFINGNDSPFGSISRQINVEIYGKSLPNSWHLNIRIWPLKGWKLKIGYVSKSNLNGDILKIRRKYKWITPDNCYYTWGWGTFKFALGCVWRARKQEFTSCKSVLENYSTPSIPEAWKDAPWWNIHKPNCRWWHKLIIAPLARHYLKKSKTETVFHR